MVVDADIAAEALQGDQQLLAQLGVGHRHHQGARSGIVAPGGLHRHVQHQLVPARSRGARLLGQVLGIGQERHGHRPWQLPRTLRARTIETDIVDHDGDQRLAVDVTKRQRVAPPGLLGRCGGNLLWLCLLFESRTRLAGLGLGIFRKTRQVFDARVPGPRHRRRRRRAALHLFQRVVRDLVAAPQIETLRDPVAGEQAAEKQHDHGDDDGVPAMRGDP